MKKTYRLQLREYSGQIKIKWVRCHSKLKEVAHWRFAWIKIFPFLYLFFWKNTSDAAMNTHWIRSILVEYWIFKLLNIGYVSNETNTDVRMYIWRIYSSRDLDTLLHKVEVVLNTLGNTLGYIQSQQWKRNVRIALGWQLTGENWENYNDMRNCHLSELMCEVSFHCLLRS